MIGLIWVVCDIPTSSQFSPCPKVILHESNCSTGVQISFQLGKSVNAMMCYSRPLFLIFCRSGDKSSPRKPPSIRTLAPEHRTTIVPLLNESYIYFVYLIICFCNFLRVLPFRFIWLNINSGLHYNSMLWCNHTVLFLMTFLLKLYSRDSK